MIEKLEALAEQKTESCSNCGDMMKMVEALMVFKDSIGEEIKGLKVQAAEDRVSKDSMREKIEVLEVQAAEDRVKIEVLEWKILKMDEKDVFTAWEINDLKGKYAASEDARKEVNRDNIRIQSTYIHPM